MFKSHCTFTYLFAAVLVLGPLAYYLYWFTYCLSVHCGVSPSFSSEIRGTASCKGFVYGASETKVVSEKSRCLGVLIDFYE